MNEIVIINATELMHHGVKGMKWGVRKDRRTVSEFNAYRSSDKQILRNKDGSYRVPKGFKFNRVGSSSLDFNKGSGLYVSYGKEDAARYVKNLGPSLMARILNESHDTVQHISVKSDLRLASEQQAIDLLSKAFNSNKELQNAFDNSIYAMAFPNAKGLSKKHTATAVSAMLGNDNYAKYNKYVLDECRKAGFDAIPDFQDIYSGTSTTPTIILNPNKISITETTYISKDVYKAAKAYSKKNRKVAYG